MLACVRFRVVFMGADWTYWEVALCGTRAEAAVRAILWMWWLATLLDLGRMVNITQLVTALDNC